MALILVGALSKSAIVPLHFWLPGAMAAPTPVSAYLHAAAMVKAGVYLVARLTPGFADAPPWRPMVVTLGLVTMLLAGWRAVREYDLKLILAFGTVSQLGLITVMVGAGGRDMMLAGLAMLVAHAMFKAALFMVVGAIDHATGTRDIRRLAWLGQASRPLLVIALGATASMAALPPFLGFVAKEADFETVSHSASLGVAAPVVLAGIVFGSVFTTIYSLRFLWGAFARKGLTQPSVRVAEIHRLPPTFLVPPAILAAAGLLFGLWPAPLDSVLDDYADTVPGGQHYTWRSGTGSNLPLLLSVLVTAAGTAAFFGRHRLRRPQAVPPAGQRRPRLRLLIRGTGRFSVRLTAVTQRGSIPATQAVILSTLVVVPVGGAGVRGAQPAGVPLWDSPVQVMVGLLMIAAALGAAVMRNRLAAVLLVGVTGYGCGAIFAFHGAPDLALTQFLVETLMLVIFVLVLRSLPAEADRADIGRFRLPSAVLSLAVGATVASLGRLRDGRPQRRRIAELLPDAAYYRGHGANTVNVLLVDIRAWDTMGEISVLLVAATGVASLVFRHRRFGAAPRVSDAGQPDIGPRRHLHQPPAAGEVTWLRGSELRDPRHRSLVLEVATRVIFPLIMVLSAYFFFAGHNTPGGGFAGGLTAGLALVLRYLAGGRYELGETLPLDAGKILGVGLGLSAGTAVGSLLLGAPVLSSAVVEFDVPVLGTVKFVTALFFDLGVYLIVVGLVLDVLRSLGARVDDGDGRPADRGRPPASNQAVTDDHLPGPAHPRRRPHQRRCLSPAGTQPDPNVVGTVADRQRG